MGAEWLDLLTVLTRHDGRRLLREEAGERRQAVSCHSAHRRASRDSSGSFFLAA